MSGHSGEIAAQLRRIAEFFEWQRAEIETAKAEAKAWQEKHGREAELRRQVEEITPPTPDPMQEFTRLSLKMLRKAAGEEDPDDA